MEPRISVDELRRFFDEDYRQILGAVTLVTGSRVVAEDAVNEAIARCWEKRDRVQQMNRWVLTVALNLARNRWRRARREVPEHDGDDRGSEPGDQVLLDLRLALRNLPARQKEVVALHYLLDLPVAEVADWLDLSEGGVKNALFKARRTLASDLTNEEVG